jgi:hypothetical protein
MTIKEANALQANLRQVMLQSLVSPRRTEPRPLQETGLFTNLVLPTMLQHDAGRLFLNQSLESLVPEELATRLSRFFDRDISTISRLDVLEAGSRALAQAIDADVPAVNRLKARLLSEPQSIEMSAEPE